MSHSMAKEKTNKVTLKVGELTGIGWFGSEYITYAGMLSKETFSLGYGTTSALFNVYFATNAKEITIKNINFKLINITPQEVVLERKS